jgi:hypothetical protein
VALMHGSNLRFQSIQRNATYLDDFRHHRREAAMPKVNPIKEGVIQIGYQNQFSTTHPQ